MVHEGHLLLILHKVPTAHEHDRRAALFWRSDAGAWKGTLEGSGGLAALKDLLAQYARILERLETRVEEATRANDYFDVLQEVAPIARAARNQHKTMQAARDAIDDPTLIDLRDQAYENERNAELVQADAQNGLDFLTARRAEEQAQVADRIAKAGHRLNMLAAFFFPATALGSLLGMNLVSGIETLKQPYLFWVVVVVALLVGFVVRGFVDEHEPAK